MKKLTTKLCAVLIGSTVIFGSLASCASTKGAENSSEKPAKAKKAKKGKFDNAAYLNAINSGDNNSALAMLSSVSDPSVDQLLDLGMLQHYSGDYKTAAETMENASAKIGEFFAASLKDDGSQKASGGAVLSETASPYEGNIYEFLLVDAFNALNYYKAGDIDSACSRVKRTEDKQKTYAGKFGYLLQEDESNGENLKKAMETAAAAGLSIEDPTKILLEKPTLEKPTKDNIYKTSAFADYLQIVLNKQNNIQLDDYIYRELKDLAPQVNTSAMEKISSGKGRIEVLALTGKIAQKKEHVENFNGFKVESLQCNFKYVWPEYNGNGNVPEVKKISLNNGTSANAVLLEDFDKNVENNVALNARKAAWRSIIRSTTTKVTAAISVNEAIKKAKNPLAQTAALKAGEASLAAVDLKEVADLRQGLALPSKSYCAGLEVAHGKYTVTVEYSNGAKDTQEVEVAAGKIVLVESVCK